MNIWSSCLAAHLTQKVVSQGVAIICQSEQVFCFKNALIQRFDGLDWILRIGCSLL